MLEIAAELVAAPDQPYRQAQVFLREPGTSEWPLCLSTISTNSAVDAVVKREVALAMINPAAALTIAHRGTFPYSAPQPVSVLGVIPSQDQLVFAIHKDSGIEMLEDVGRAHFPLKVGLRAQDDHCIHMILDHVCAAAGFSLDDARRWGGGGVRVGSLPRAGDRKFQMLADGELNAIFDEGSAEWLEDALDMDMTILELAEGTVQKLEGLGYRRSLIQRDRHPRLPHDILTIDFSGWPIFVRADLPDELVVQMCTGLDARKAFIPWEQPGALPVERMCRDAQDTPLDVPLHAAAERHWRECGYLR